MADVPGLIPLLPEVLSRRPLQQQQQPHPGNTAAAASRPSVYSPQVVPAVTTSSSSSGGMNGSVNMASLDVEVQGEVAGAAVEDADLEKAQAQLAWVVAALASSTLTRCDSMHLLKRALSHVWARDVFFKIGWRGWWLHWPPACPQGAPRSTEACVVNCVGG
jgi:hypothetical protein